MTPREWRHLPAGDKPAVAILVAHEPARKGLQELLQENGYPASVMANPQQVIRLLRQKKCATVFVDCEALKIHSTGICSKFKVACPYCRVVLLCDKSLAGNRQIIREAMEIGIYACLLPPYKDWEVLTMVSFYPRVCSI
jgi:DNA-binding NarL/FixJ family response regulator